MIVSLLSEGGRGTLSFSFYFCPIILCLNVRKLVLDYLFFVCVCVFILKVSHVPFNWTFFSPNLFQSVFSQSLNCSSQICVDAQIIGGFRWNQ